MFRSSSSFDRLLEKATSNLLLEPDWNSIMGICDAIRSGETAPKYAVNAIKKKFYHENPHVVIYALQVMESCVKNCGSLVHEEVATKAFMEELREMIKHTNEENVRNKLLELIQTWGMAFRSSQKYRIVTETLNVMKAEGWKFPPVREAEAMFEADNAPDWAEGEVCHRCRVQFGMMTRQHHCRACGQVFCSKCSSKSCVLPKFGIEREVRVCDSCFDQHGPKESANSSPSKLIAANTMSSDSDLPAECLASSLAQQSQAPPPKSGKTEEELKEEEELQLAIALSQSEAQAKEDAKKRGSYSSPKINEEPKESKKGEELSPELMRYLNRDYWEQKEKEKAEIKAQGYDIKVDVKNSMQPVQLQQVAVQQTLPPALAGGASSDELDEFVTTLKTQVEIFVNRMKSNSSRGRSITNDSSVQTLFMNTMAMHSKLLKHIQDQEDKRVYYEGLQDNIAQVKDARAALDALREEERERKRREAEEAERLRQVQMREKLEVMRKKKQEYLQYQRQIALQRMQEQEREMKLRQEQAKQQYMMMQQPPYGQQPMYGGGMVPMPPPAAMMPQQPSYMQYPPYMPAQQQGMPPQQPAMPAMPGQPPVAMPGQPPAAMPGQPPAAMPGQPPAAMPGQPPAAMPGQPPAAIQGPAAGMIPPVDNSGSFNMQGMASTLPTTTAPMPPMPTQQGPGYPMNPGMPATVDPNMAPQMQMGGPPTSQPGAPEAPSESLIFFD